MTMTEPENLHIDQSATPEPSERTAWLREKMLKAWQTNRPVAISGQVLVWVALLMGENQVADADARRLGVDWESARKSWQQFRMRRQGPDKLEGTYVSEAGEHHAYWTVRINLREDYAVVQYVKSARIEGYRFISSPSLGDILSTLRMFGWNPHEGDA